MGRVADELVRTATGLVRALERSQQQPAPIIGTALADAVDVAALDSTWGNGLPGSAGDGPVQRPVTPGAATEVDPEGRGLVLRRRMQQALRRSRPGGRRSRGWRWER